LLGKEIKPNEEKSERDDQRKKEVILSLIDYKLFVKVMLSGDGKSDNLARGLWEIYLQGSSQELNLAVVRDNLRDGKGTVGLQLKKGTGHSRKKCPRKNIKRLGKIIAFSALPG